MLALLFLAEMAAAIYLLVVSPKKLQTFGRMVLAFVMTMLILLLLPAALRRSNFRAWGQLAGILAPPAAVLGGWLNVRSLRRPSQVTTPVPPTS